MAKKLPQTEHLATVRAIPFLAGEGEQGGGAKKRVASRRFQRLCPIPEPDKETTEPSGPLGIATALRRPGCITSWFAVLLSESAR